LVNIAHESNNFLLEYKNLFTLWVVSPYSNSVPIVCYMWYKMGGGSSYKM